MSKWHLYWVASDGAEDCFVVAKNSLSAKRVEKDMNGFEDGDLEVYKVMPIPDKYEKMAKKEFIDWSIKNNANQGIDLNTISPWPYYAYDWLLKKLGAEFRTIDGVRQVLINDVVYEPFHVYPIGARAMSELYNMTSDKKLDYTNVSNEDIEEAIDRMLGKSITLVHEVEDNITNSFIFGADNDKYSGFTINEAINYWKKKFTFGRLIKLMEENFDIDEDVRNAFELFLQQRNKIAHGLTQEERYDINTLWGQKELVAFLALFITNAFAILPITEGALLASVSLGYNLMKDKKEKMPPQIKKEMETFNNDPDVLDKINLFFDVFKLKNKGNQ